MLLTRVLKGGEKKRPNFSIHLQLYFNPCFFRQSTLITLSRCSFRRSLMQIFRRYRLGPAFFTQGKRRKSNVAPIIKRPKKALLSIMLFYIMGLRAPFSANPNDTFVDDDDGDINNNNNDNNNLINTLLNSSQIEN